MDIQQVSTALAYRLRNLNIRTYDYGPDAPVSPCAFIYPQDILEYHASYDPTRTANFVIRFLISSTDTKDGQEQLNALISPTGVKSAVAAIEGDKTLGGAVDDSRITEMRNYGVIVLPDQASRYYSAELVVEVYA